jgi:hypothetical protein
MAKSTTHTTIHTDLDFRISHSYDLYWLEHCCPCTPEYWKLMWCDITARERHCDDCGRSATPGLQTVFLFLKGA